MSRVSFSRSSISKQRGAAMSSRLIPPKVGASAVTVRTISSVSFVVQADRERIYPGELLEQTALALHHGHRRQRADIPEPEHGAAVGDDGHGVALDRVLEGAVLVLGDRQADAGDARRVEHREVVAGLQRVAVALFDLAPEMQQEGAVGGVDRLGPRDRVDRLDDVAPVLARPGVDDDVPQAAGAVHLDDVDGAHDAARGADLAGDGAERVLGAVELDADRDAVLGARCCAHFMVLPGSWRQEMLGGIKLRARRRGAGCPPRRLPGASS